jgi:hypothetical protein
MSLIKNFISALFTGLVVFVLMAVLLAVMAPLVGIVVNENTAASMILYLSRVTFSLMGLAVAIAAILSIYYRLAGKALSTQGFETFFDWIYWGLLLIGALIVFTEWPDLAWLLFIGLIFSLFIGLMFIVSPLRFLYRKLGERER